jgi:hypothetical protein
MSGLKPSSHETLVFLVPPSKDMETNVDRANRGDYMAVMRGALCVVFYSRRWLLIVILGPETKC